MTFTQRLLSIGAAGALLFGGMAFSRLTDSPKSISADEVKTALTETPKPASDNETFYLKDFQTGYDDGFAAGRNGQTNGSVATEREGYNEGFKKGYADAYQKQAGQSVAYQNGQQRVYKPANYPPKRKGNSKLKTALTIAAPAAVGAGIGVAAGGKKGAAAGALIGGGGGALYHLYKNRNR
ncbi:MAG: hypothetical protein ACKVZH_17055 [Blastocatellia bacterium]